MKDERDDKPERERMPKAAENVEAQQGRCPICGEFLYVVQLRHRPGWLCGCGERE